MIHHVSPSSKYSSNTSNTSQSAGAASHAAQSLVVNATGNGPPPPGGPGALGAGVQPSPPVAVGTASGPGAAAAATTAPETNNLFGRIKKACSVKTKFATSSLKHSLQSHQQQTQQQQNPVTVAVPPPPPKLVNSKGVVNPTSKAMLRPNSAKSKSEPKVPIGTPLTIATAAQLSSSVSSGSSSSSSSSSSASSGVPPVITGAVTKSPAIGANCSPSKQLLNSLFSSATPLGQVQDHGMVQDRGFHQQPQMNNNNGVQRLNNSRQQPPLPPSTLPLAPANEMAPAEPQQLKSCPLGAISPDSLLLLSTNVTLRRKTPKKMMVVGTASFSPPLETTLGSPEVSPKQLSPSPAQHRGRVTSTSSSSSPPSSGHNQLTGGGGTDSLELLSASSAAAAAAAETSNRPGDTAAAAANGTVVTAAADHPKQFEARGSSAVEQQQQQLATVVLGAAGEQTATSTFEDVFCKFCCGGAGGVEALERQKSCRHSAPEAVLGMFLLRVFEEF